MKILNVLKDTPIPTILVVAGLLFLVLSFMTKDGWKIKAPGKQQKVSIAIGAVLLFFGISLFLFPTMADNLGLNNPPTIMGVTIRESHEGGELVYYQEINFYDDDGNTNTVEWDLVDLSDPAQRQYIHLQNGVINDLPEIQKIRSTTTGTWYCEGRIYVATLEVSLLDRDGNRSESVRYTIDCK
jgi:hypothetical protein